MKRTALQRRTPLRAKRKHAETRVGKLGIVRLTGKAMERLRSDCWFRDRALCQECATVTNFKPRYDGDPFAFHMAHIKSRGAGGSDELSNVHTLCHRCHMQEHAKGRRANR